MDIVPSFHFMAGGVSTTSMNDFVSGGRNGPEHSASVLLNLFLFQCFWHWNLPRDGDELLGQCRGTQIAIQVIATIILKCTRY